MKTYLLKAGILFLVAVDGGTALSNDPVDQMPTPGNRIPELEQRIRRLEERLSALENGPNQGEPAAAQNPKPSAAVLAALEKANELLKSGDTEGAAKAYQELLNDSLSHLTATPQALTDTFTVAYSLSIAGETMLGKGQNDLAKKLWEAALKGIHGCEETLPGWNKTIVEWRRNKVEERLARLK